MQVPPSQLTGNLRLALLQPAALPAPSRAWIPAFSRHINTAAPLNRPSDAQKEVSTSAGRGGLQNDMRKVASVESDMSSMAYRIRGRTLVSGRRDGLLGGPPSPALAPPRHVDMSQGPNLRMRIFFSYLALFAQGYSCMGAVVAQAVGTSWIQPVFACWPRRLPPVRLRRGI